MVRSIDDFNHEREALDTAHAQNEAGRDAFLAIAHTALFAASISFLGDVAPVGKAIWLTALIAAWSASVVGLSALTLSFSAARRQIDARRAALNEAEEPPDRLASTLNAVALWSFPVALVCLFSFVTANVVSADERQTQAAAPTQPTSKPRAERHDSAATVAKPSTTKTLDGGRSSSEGAIRSSATANANAPTNTDSSTRSNAADRGLERSRH
jgi:hypothetical protein